MFIVHGKIASIWNDFIFELILIDLNTKYEQWNTFCDRENRSWKSKKGSRCNNLLSYFFATISFASRNNKKKIENMFIPCAPCTLGAYVFSIFNTLEKQLNTILRFFKISSDTTYLSPDSTITKSVYIF